jgi:hypothetical protein
MLSTSDTTKPLCKVCRKPFVQYSSFQTVCRTAKCAVRVPVLARKAQKASDRARKDALKSLSDWTVEAQKAFNAWIRWRDRFQTCIDCGQPFEPQRPGGSVDAGHYLSRGSAPHLKFDERNTFAQRKNCNRPGGATRADFRAGVIARIGLEAVEALESDQSTKRYRAVDLRAIRDEYRSRLKAEQLSSTA